jgi:hypothetical protein
MGVMSTTDVCASEVDRVQYPSRTASCPATVQIALPRLYERRPGSIRDLMSDGARRRRPRKEGVPPHGGHVCVDILSPDFAHVAFISVE